MNSLVLPPLVHFSFFPFFGGGGGGGSSGHLFEAGRLIK